MEDHMQGLDLNNEEEKQELHGMHGSAHVQQYETTNGRHVHVITEEEGTEEPKRICCKTAPCRIGCKKWAKKYFLEGQILSADQARKLDQLPTDAPFFDRLLTVHRRPLGMILPALFFNFWWLAYAIRYSIWHLFPTKYFMTITMFFGSMMAGMTSVGGGAVAFPVMTLAFAIAPDVARDFSLMIQACGMCCAAFTIFFMKIQLDGASLIFCSLGGVPGLIFGLELVDPLLTAPQKKMGFVCVWFSFAFALFLLNRYSKRQTFTTIPNLTHSKRIVLLLTGFIGGLCTSFAGSGLDMCAFSVLTLVYRVSEKTATPTSVVLMAGNTMAGFYWRHIMMQGITQEGWDYLLVTIPIVVIGAPLGSLMGSHFHRQVLAIAVYVLDTVALVLAFIIVPQTPVLVGISVGLIVGGFVFFYLLTFMGNRLLRKETKLRLEQDNEEKCDVVEDSLADPITSI